MHGVPQHIEHFRRHFARIVIVFHQQDAPPGRVGRAHEATVGQQMADAPRQVFALVRFAQQLHARVQPPALHDGVVRVARGKQYGQFRQQQSGLLCQFLAADGAGHDHVRKQQVDGHARAQKGQRRGAVIGMQHVVAEAAQHVDHRVLHGCIVFHDEDGLATAQHGARQARRRFGQFFQRTGQINLERRAGARRAVHLDVARALADEAVRHGQAQASALAFALGGEEGLEDLVDYVALHAVARVGDGQQHVLPFQHVRMLAGVGGVECDVAQGKSQPPALVHRIARIDGHVQQHVFHLVRVDQGMPQAVADEGLLGNRLAQRAADQLMHAAQQAAQVRHKRFQRLAPRKGQQLRRQLGAPLDGRGGRIEAPGRLRIVGHRQFQQLQIAGNDLQDVIEIVGHAARQLADRFELLRLQ
ncbi:hypothetical protein D3C87_540380 [compost metagenome]